MIGNSIKSKIEKGSAEDTGPKIKVTGGIMDDSSDEEEDV
jgi:hypothetical protein